MRALTATRATKNINTTIKGAMYCLKNAIAVSLKANDE